MMNQIIVVETLDARTFMLMDKSKYLDKVLRRYPAIITDSSRDSFIYDIQKMYDEGWDLKDTLAYIATFEEVNPNLDETVALERRARIEIPKYIGEVHLYVYNFKALGELLS